MRIIGAESETRYMSAERERELEVRWRSVHVYRISLSSR